MSDNVIIPAVGTPVATFDIGSGVQLQRVSVGAKRDAGTLHRSAVATADVLAAPGTLTSLADVTSGGSLAQGTTFFVAATAGNKYGNTTVSNGATPQSQATAASGGSVHCVRFTLPQVAGADYYDLFLSTDAAPKWVARCTETQRANANGVQVTAVGTASAGSSLGAGVIKINVQGTGAASNTAPFVVNNAYTPDSITGVVFTGRTLIRVKVVVAVTDLRSLPAVTLIPFFINQNDGFYDQGEPFAVPLLVANGQSLRSDWPLQVDAGTLVIVADTISGQGTTVTVSLEAC